LQESVLARSAGRASDVDYALNIDRLGRRRPDIDEPPWKAKSTTRETQNRFAGLRRF